MAFEVVVPQMGESVLEGTIVEWKVAEGDKIKVNQPLVEIMTDKVNIELPSPVDGVMEKILVPPGEVVPVGKLICRIAVTGQAPAPAETTKPPKSPAAAASTAAVPAAAAAPPGAAPRMTPAVRKLVRDFGLDPASVVGTGPDGRITTEDVQKTAASRSAVAGVTAPKAAPVLAAKYTPAPTTPGERIEERIPLAGARKMIADHMRRSRQISAHVTTFEDCDFTSLVEYRATMKEQFLAAYGVKLTFMPFIIKAAVECLKQFPTVNASMTDTEIILKKYYNIGIAVARDVGLIVPVVHDADRKSIIDLAVAINDLGARARTDQLKLEEVQGGTFTVTNAGMFGATASTPVINQPQVAILGVHKIAPKPVVRDGQIVIRHMSTFGMSFDHRLIDGHTAVQFLHRLIEYLEYPTSLFLSSRG
jgi:2-oxoglutarate dehydrogenase E2 component (dihydrolipoamide succinyltransferase)